MWVGPACRLDQPGDADLRDPAHRASNDKSPPVPEDGGEQALRDVGRGMFVIECVYDFREKVLNLRIHRPSLVHAFH